MQVSNFINNRKYSIQQQGSTLTVSDPSHSDCRCPGDFFYSVEVDSDTISLHGSDKELGQIDYSIGLNSKGVQVSSPDNRRFSLISEGETEMPKAQQQQFGLNVASSMLGVPLFFDPSKAEPPTQATLDGMVEISTEQVVGRSFDRRPD